jgi:hypothetical protein
MVFPIVLTAAVWQQIRRIALPHSQFAEKLGFGVAQRFTAAISRLF